MKAWRTGRFVVSLGRLSPGCALVVVKATGSKGSRASLGPPECVQR